MKTNQNFDLDPEISQILGKIRRIKNLNIDLNELLEPDVSSFELRRRARASYCRYRALRFSAMAEQRREHLEYEWREEETKRIEQLVKEVAKEVYLFEDDDDAGQKRDLILFYRVNFSGLIGIDDERIKRAFKNKAMYWYLDNDGNTARPSDFWERTIERFCAPGA